MLTEREIIQAIRERLPAASGEVVRGIGDDCAVFKATAEKEMLVTTDTLVEGVHFDLSWHPAELLGRKAVAVNASDIAAMGGVPRYAFLSLVLPPDTRDRWLSELLAGIGDGLAGEGIQLLGGDTVKGPVVMLSVTMIGEAPPGGALLRSGARQGDLVWVSGFLGEAAAGLALCRQPAGVSAAAKKQLLAAHLAPTAQVELGTILAGSGLVHAMLDLSDGLATDLAHLAAESGLGAEVEAGSLPLSAACREAAAALREDPIAWAIGGGEDYQLLFTAPAAHRPALEKLVQGRTGLRLHCIGRMVAEPGVVLCREGRRFRIDYQGYDHFGRTTEV